MESRAPAPGRRGKEASVASRWIAGTLAGAAIAKAAFPRSGSVTAPLPPGREDAGVAG